LSIAWKRIILHRRKKYLKPLHGKGELALNQKTQPATPHPFQNFHNLYKFCKKQRRFYVGRHAVKIGTFNEEDYVKFLTFCTNSAWRKKQAGTYTSNQHKI